MFGVRCRASSRYSSNKFQSPDQWDKETRHFVELPIAAPTANGSILLNPVVPQDVKPYEPSAELGLYKGQLTHLGKGSQAASNV
jgi:hypothetical protein